MFFAKNFDSKNEKRVGVQNDVKGHFFYSLCSFTIGSNESSKCVKFNTSQNAVKLKMKRLNLGESIRKMKSFITLKK